MEVYQKGIYWYVRTPCGPVPNELKGMWVTKDRLETAIKMYRGRIKANTVNVTQKGRERKQRAASNRQVSD
jgi:hypothetical protein